MTISSIGSTNYTMGQMLGMGIRSNPADRFNKIDEDDSGGLDQTEFSSLAGKVSQMTGEDIDAESVFTEYDEDGDGELSEEETKAFMDGNRPQGPAPGGMMGGMGGMQGPPLDLSQLFSDADEDEDGSLNETEAQGIANMISNATGEDMTVDNLIAAYDGDGDGMLSEEETLTALEANRPEGPPLTPPEGVGGSQNTSWAKTNGIENYMMVAGLGMGQDQSSTPSAMFGGDGEFLSTGGLFSVTTMA